MRQKNLGGDLETNEIESRQHAPSMIEEQIELVFARARRNLTSKFIKNGVLEKDFQPNT